MADPLAWLVMGIQLLGVLLLALHAGVAAVVALTSRRPEHAHRLVVDGVALALSLMLAATVIRLFAIGTWEEIGMVAAIAALRALAKRSFVRHAAGLGQIGP